MKGSQSESTAQDVASSRKDQGLPLTGTEDVHDYEPRLDRDACSGRTADDADSDALPSAAIADDTEVPPTSATSDMTFPSLCYTSYPPPEICLIPVMVSSAQ